MKIIMFTDGSFLRLHNDSNLLEGGTLHSGLYDNNLIALYDNGYKGFTGTKTDLDGNTWVFTEYNVTINNSYSATWSSNYRVLGNIWYLGETNDNITIGCISQTNINRTPLHQYSKTGSTGSYVYYLGYINDTNSQNPNTYAQDVAQFTTMAEFNRLSMKNGLYSENTNFISVLYNLFGKSNGYEIPEGGFGAPTSATTIPKTLFTNSYQDEPTAPTDPYANAGDSDTGGGDGTFDGSSDPVDIPSLPTVGATDAGFITLFAPTSSQLHALASYCWSNLFDIDTFKKLFNDPMDCILGLSVVPVSVPTSGAREITVGNIVTTVQMNVASQQYIEVDCGSISFVNKYFGSYLDYEPYTKMAIFLPYCGTHQISADDVMGKTITVKYHIDILTGSCIAFVKCGDSVLYEFNGACASNIPVNSLNYSSTIENAIRIAVNIGTTVATAGASAPLSTATEGASAVATAQNIGRGISLAGSTAEGALSMKPSVSRSGAMGGGVGLLGNQIPYMIITRPRLCKPKNQDHFEGYPSFIYSKIEDLIGQGFTSFTDVIINEQFLTDEEENELEAILKGGVYL